MRIIKDIIRILQWLPVIWRDVDWDYSGLLDIIDYKVRRMRQHHTAHSFGAHWSLRTLEMDELRHLIALQKEDPDDEWSAYFYSHKQEDINEPITFEKRRALQRSSKRDERNWHNVWAYLDKTLRYWWD